MFEFINVMKFFATILITNSHFSFIYPENLSFMSFGGLLGDILFFYASGFCLINVKTNFLDWYSRRIVRIYPAVWIITILCRYLNIYFADEYTTFGYYVYPTYYHFIGAILLLYIFYYIVLKVGFLRKNLKYIIMIISAGYLVYYFFGFNYRGLGFNQVETKHIKCFFFIIMLLGAYHRMNVEKIKQSKHKNFYLFAWIIALAGYFLKEILYKKYDVYQVLNQVLLFVFIYCLTKWLIIIEEKLKFIQKTPFNNIINIVSSITLEVYVVQYLYIYYCCKIPFPMNLIVTVSGIFVAAYVLNKLDNAIYKGYCRLIEKTRKAK